MHRARNAQVIEAQISWNYTTWLNIVFLLLAAVLVVRFVRTGGVPMLRMMGGNPDNAGEHDHHHNAPGHGGHGHGDHDQDASRGQPTADHPAHEHRN
jgi:hypothetical protein